MIKDKENTSDFRVDLEKYVEGAKMFNAGNFNIIKYMFIMFINFFQHIFFTRGCTCTACTPSDPRLI